MLSRWYFRPLQRWQGKVLDEVAAAGMTDVASLFRIDAPAGIVMT